VILIRPVAAFQSRYGLEFHSSGFLVFGPERQLIGVDHQTRLKAHPQQNDQGHRDQEADNGRVPSAR
jgi:hypothetical protein